MFCPACGKEMPVGEKICICGYVVDDELTESVKVEEEKEGEKRNPVSNIGGKVKDVARVLSVISAVCVIVLAFIFGWQEEVSTYYTSSEFQPAAFFMTLIIGGISCYLEYILLYAFGDLVENTMKIREHLDNRYKGDK